MAPKSLTQKESGGDWMMESGDAAAWDPRVVVSARSWRQNSGINIF